MAFQATSSTILQELEPFYLYVADEKVEGRQITTYQLKEGASLQKAVEAIKNLLKNKKELIPIFDREKLESSQLQGSPYLIQNENALCLSKEKRAGAHFPLLLIDRFFSLQPLRDPVQCLQGHHFERSSIEFWMKETGKEGCPAQEDHFLKPIEADEMCKISAQQLQEQSKVIESMVKFFKLNMQNCIGALTADLVEKNSVKPLNYSSLKKLKNILNPAVQSSLLVEEVTNAWGSHQGLQGMTVQISSIEEKSMHGVIFTRLLLFQLGKKIEAHLFFYALCKGVGFLEEDFVEWKEKFLDYVSPSRDFQKSLMKDYEQTTQIKLYISNSSIEMKIHKNGNIFANYEIIVLNMKTIPALVPIVFKKIAK